MKNSYCIIALLGVLLSLVACSETDDTQDTYYNWKSRNAAWFQEVMDSAKADTVNWHIYKSLEKSPLTAGVTSDYVVCKVLRSASDPDGISPTYSDSVLLYYRGWIMNTKYPEDKSLGDVFSQTYYGVLDTATAAPIAMPVSGTVEGFQTALQYMRDGDDWLVYIPQQLAYQSEASDAIPAYSTLCFRLTLKKVHLSGSGLDDWK